MLQSVLEQPKIRGGTLFFAIERLAWLYRDTGQYEKEAQVWLDAIPRLPAQSWMVPDMLVGAARAYTAQGKEEQAQQLYARVPEYGQGWFTGLIYYDSAHAMIKRGEHEAARRLLETPVNGVRAEQVRVGLLSLLSASYLKTGQLDLAQSAATQATQAYAALKTPPRNMGLEYQDERAHKVLEMCQRVQEQQGARNERAIDRLLR